MVAQLPVPPSRSSSQAEPSRVQGGVLSLDQLSLLEDSQGAESTRRDRWLVDWFTNDPVKNGTRDQDPLRAASTRLHPAPSRRDRPLAVAPP